MGKGSKKRNKKKSDFQKVKFKVGKKIAKGNVVDTTFKTKKILIREQLKAGVSSSQAVAVNDVRSETSVPKKNIQEILRHVNHLNPSARVNALTDLKETLVAHPELSVIHLSAIVGRSVSLCVDKETTVRKAAVAFLKYLFASVDSAQLVPHLHVVVAHVRCAMSHISHDVRSSALLVVDLIVEHFGDSTKSARFSGQLLMDFVEQISEGRSTLSMNSKPVEAVSTQQQQQQHQVKRRALTADPSTGVTSVAWHLQVARRLRAILRNIWSQVNVARDGRESQTGREGILIAWNPQEPLHVPLRYGTKIGLTDLVNRKDLSDFFEDKTQMNFLFSNLIPLLFEMWVEAHSLNSGLARNLVSGESLEVYSCVIDVVQLLWKLIDYRKGVEREQKESYFDEQFEQKFQAHCMRGFPYADHSAPLRKKRKKAVVLPLAQRHDAFSLNLSLCYVATCLDSFADNPTVWKYLLTFIEGDGWNAKHAETVVHVLEKFLECRCEQTFVLLSAIHKLCSRLSVQRRERKQLLNLLHDLLTLPIYGHLLNAASMWDWVASLPEQILKYDAGIPWEILRIFQCVAYRGQTKFLSSVQSKLAAILDYLLQYASKDDEVWDRNFKVVANLLYWVPQCNAHLLAKVTQVCADDRLSVQHRKYVLQLLDGRVQRQNNRWCKTWCNESAYSTLLSNIGPISTVIN